tara:strand:- start:159 stop:308 length:150 start_codon:yes stop_codon:yes gene_type:complete
MYGLLVGLILIPIAIFVGLRYQKNLEKEADEIRSDLEKKLDDEEIGSIF